MVWIRKVDSKPQLATHRCIDWIYKCNFCNKSCIKPYYTFYFTSTYENNRTIYLHSNFLNSLQNLKRSNYVDRFLQTKIFRFPKYFCTQCSVSDTHSLLLRIRIQASLGLNIFWKLKRYRNIKFFTFSNLGAILPS